MGVVPNDDDHTKFCDNLSYGLKVEKRTHTHMHGDIMNLLWRLRKQSGLKRKISKSTAV